MRHLVAVGLTVLTCACSTMPRSYSPILAPSEVSALEVETATEHCTRLVNSGVRTDFHEHRVASAATGVVVGYGTGALAVAGTGTTLAGTAAAVSAAAVVMPIAGIAGAIIYSNRVRARREHEIQAAMTECLRETGIVVDGWERIDTTE